MAGEGLAKYATNPQTLSQLGKRVAMETALGTAASQAVPRMIGATPPPLAQSALNVGLQSVFSAPVAGGLKAAGVPEWAAGTIGQVAGTVGSHMVSRAITPEPQQQPQVQGADFERARRLEAAIEQQRYNNQINLALARNYNHPSVITHRNPSADFQNVYNALNPRNQY